MSTKHPIISVTGSSGAGTSTVEHTFSQIFLREGVNAALIEGDAFHRYDREEMKRRTEKESKNGDSHFSHFGPEANLSEDLAYTFRQYGETGTARTRHYIHDQQEADLYKSPAGTFTDWTEVAKDTDLLFYEGLHGALLTDKVDISSLVDLKIGVVPTINLEWIQKIHRDKSVRGYSTEAVTKTILRRMPDYVNYVCPQFSQTDINFQRVPTVDTSNPFVARWIPTADESMLVIRFADPYGIDFSYLTSMLQNSFMSRANSIVVPGGKLDLAMQLVLTPLIHRLIERKRRAG